MESKRTVKLELHNIKQSIDIINQQYKENSTKLSQIDLLISDLYHEIEFDKLTAPQMMIKFKELKACLKIRRTYKNEHEYLQSVVSSLNNSKIEVAISNSNRVEKKESEKIYKKRIKDEVRNEILKYADEL